MLTGYLALPESDYPDGESQVLFADELLRDVRALPGVTEASITSQIPFGGGGSSSVILPEGYMPSEGESLLSPWNTTVGPGYFEALGIPLIAGRYFDESDNQDARQAIVIDEWLAQRYYPDEDPVGKRMLWGTLPNAEEDQEDNLYSIVGVVGSIKQNDLTEEEQRAVAAFMAYLKDQREDA